VFILPALISWWLATRNAQLYIHTINRSRCHCHYYKSRRKREWFRAGVESRVYRAAASPLRPRVASSVDTTVRPTDQRTQHDVYYDKWSFWKMASMRAQLGLSVDCRGVEQHAIKDKQWTKAKKAAMGQCMKISCDRPDRWQDCNGYLYGPGR